MSEQACTVPEYPMPGDVYIAKMNKADAWKTAETNKTYMQRQVNKWPEFLENDTFLVCKTERIEEGYESRTFVTLFFAGSIMKVQWPGNLRLLAKSGTLELRKAE